MSKGLIYFPPPQKKPELQEEKEAKKITFINQFAKNTLLAVITGKSKINDTSINFAVIQFFSG